MRSALPSAVSPSCNAFINATTPCESAANASNYYKRPNVLKQLFQRITPSDAIAAELAEAEMALLKAETGVEYAQSLVDYNTARIKRLKAYLTTEVAP